MTIYIEVSGTSVYHAIPCSEVEYILNDQELYTRDFLQCQTSWTGSPITHVAVRAGFDNELAATAGIRVVFGAATWGGLWINALVCEYYLFKTSDESDRLKLISEKRQKVRQTLRERQIGTQ
ncbi:hypothetical protein FRC12_023036 [Ceratobasidium sp. 428]|nr:hypothetical protein FRC12_023036 [Ceratobasidium sp. 428]